MRNPTAETDRDVARWLIGVHLRLAIKEARKPVAEMTLNAFEAEARRAWRELEGRTP